MHIPILRCLESERAVLKLNIKKTKIMVSAPITSQQIDGGKVETVTDFIFLCSKITADGDCGHEIKRCLLLGRKAMAKLASILKSKDITLLTKVHEVKVKGFPDGPSKEHAFQCRKYKRCGFDPWVGRFPWRKAWQPTPVFLPGESCGQRSVVGYSPQGCKELDTTEGT